MAAALYFGHDDRLPKILESFFVIRKEDAGEAHTVSQTTDTRKFEEALVGVNFEIIYIETAILDKTPIEWMESFQKRFARIKSPVVLLGDEHDPSSIMKLIDAGFADYIVTPPDRPLVIEKFGVLTTGKRDRDIRQVYSLKMSQRMDLAKPGILEEISEFDCKLRSSKAIPVNELLVLYAEPMSDSGTEKAAVLGRCYECKDHPSFKGQFIVSFFFLGPTPDILKNIRNALRKSYVANKSKS